MSRYINNPTAQHIAPCLSSNNWNSIDSTYTLWRASVHEASHAICHVANGIKVKKVEVYRENKHWIGFTSTERQPGVTPLSPIRTDLAVGSGFLAGHIGELIHASPVPEYHNFDEILTAQMVSQTLAMKSHKVDLYKHTGIILLRNNPSLLALANTLMSQKLVSGTQLIHLLKGVN